MPVLESDVGAGELFDGDLQAHRLHPHRVVDVVQDGEDGPGGALEARGEVEAPLARPEHAVLLPQEHLRRDLDVSHLQSSFNS